MIDLISRQETIEWLKEACDVGQIDPHTNAIRRECFREAIECIEDIPSKHGKWIIRETVLLETEAKCSVCGFETLVNEPGNGLHMVRDLHYCPNCGATMDGGADTRKDDSSHPLADSDDIYGG